MPTTKITFKGTIEDLVGYVQRFLESYPWTQAITCDPHPLDRDDRRGGKRVIIGSLRSQPVEAASQSHKSEYCKAPFSGSFTVAVMDFIKVTSDHSELRFKVSDWLHSMDDLTRTMDEEWEWNRWPSSPEDRQRVTDDCQRLIDTLNREMMARGLAAGGPITYGPAGRETEEPPRPKWFPTSEAGLKRYKKAHAIIVDMEEAYLDEDDPTPTIDDYREALSPVYHKWPSDRTVRRILKAGKRGWLGDDL